MSRCNGNLSLDSFWLFHMNGICISFCIYSNTISGQIPIEVMKSWILCTRHLSQRNWKLFPKKNRPFPWGLNCGWQMGKELMERTLISGERGASPWGSFFLISCSWLGQFRWDCGSATECSLVVLERLSTEKTMGKYQEFHCKLTLLCNIDRRLSNSKRSEWVRGKQTL